MVAAVLANVSAMNLLNQVVSEQHRMSMRLIDAEIARLQHRGYPGRIELPYVPTHEPETFADAVETSHDSSMFLAGMRLYDPQPPAPSKRSPKGRKRR